MEDLRIHAIEGSELAKEGGISTFLGIVKKSREKTVVFVISPVASDELSVDSAISAAENGEDEGWREILDSVKKAWSGVDESIALSKGSEIDEYFSKIGEILKAIRVLGEAPDKAKKYIYELTGTFLAEILSRRLDAEKIKSTVMTPFDAVKGASLPKGVVLVSGNLYRAPNSRDASGKSRSEGGSEYTASLIASAHGAPLTFWNSRSLLSSASKKDVPTCEVIKNLTYNEAIELSFFGAPIIHPQSMLPAASRNIPITLKYWGSIDNPGTLISNEAHAENNLPVKAFSVVRNIALVNVEGSGMSGVPGISGRLFSAMKSEGISVILISQASSEYSICFAVPESESDDAWSTVRKEFRRELEEGLISEVTTEKDLSILAAVGEGMNGRVGVAGKFFSSLASAGVNIRAIAQGSSERNISVVIKASESRKALRALHSAFFLSPQTLSVGLFGPGNIGGTLLNQIGSEGERLKREADLDIRIRGIANSEKMLLSEEGINLSSWKDEFGKNAVPFDEEVFLSHINASYYPHAVLIDCTSSEKRAMQYRTWIEAGFHIVTPNKKAGAGPYEYYRSLNEASVRTGKKFLYETTVGAGLPVICTLKDLRQTGDKVYKVEGMVSGTLAWLFASYDGTVPFSSLVMKAKSLGYTEPDPRDDLSGMDVARKTVILARELGYDAEVSDMRIESLVPEELKKLSPGEFLDRLSEVDERMLSLYEDAKSRGMSLRYVGKVENGKCSVSLAEYPENHPFSNASGTDNVIMFTTQRYNEQPLVIKGPGAGPDVTAGGVFSDLLRLGVYLGSKV